MAHSVQIDTRRYVNSHGKAPNGRGNWWFEILNDQYVYSDAPYGQATRAAHKELKRRCLKLGISNPPTIVLLP